MKCQVRPRRQGVPAASRGSLPPKPNPAQPRPGHAPSRHHPLPGRPEVGESWRQRPGPGGVGSQIEDDPPQAPPPRPGPEGGTEARKRLTGLMGIQVLAGHVVVNHIFFQGRESESVDWERRERTRALGAEAAAGLPAGLRQPAAPSRRPAALRLGPASSPRPGPWGAPAGCSPLGGHASAASPRPPPQGTLLASTADPHLPPCHPQACPSG